MMIGLVIFVVVLLVTGGFTLFLVSDHSEKLKTNNLPSLDLEDVIYGRYSGNGFNASWATDNEILYRNDANNDIILFNMDTQKSKILLNLDDSIYLPPLTYELSSDGKFLLITHQIRKVFRYSTLAIYVIIDLDTKESHPLVAPDQEPLVQIATWAPIGNSIVFVHKNNVFYKKNAADKEVHQITKDGEIGTIFNGIPDWIYEEEIFASDMAFWISPDGNNLVYAKFTDTSVPAIVLPIYGEPEIPEFQYPKANQIRYPKAGTPNPKVTLHMVNLDNFHVNQLESPNISEPVLSAVAWANSTTVDAIWMNRVQNEAFIIAYSIEQPNIPKTVKYLSEPRGWLELFTPPVFSKDGSKFLLILSQEQDKHVGSYRHLVMFENKEKGMMKPLTKGKFVVTSIHGWSSDDTIYYTATTENDTAVRHIFKVQFSYAGTYNHTHHCITCNLKRSKTNMECLFNSAQFSIDLTYAMVQCDGPAVPETFLFKGSNIVQVWENNEELFNDVQNLAIPSSQRYSIKLSNGFTAHVMLQLPPNLDKFGKTKYPMLVEVYAGPDTQQVTEEFRMNWGTYLASNKSIIHAAIDGRGSGMQGDQILFELYRKIGTVEVYDQINVTRQLQKELPFIDASRTAIWGWSYGGYVAGMALALDPDGVFKCGISVAPVTDWTLYDSIYTERYMGLPTKNDNLIGYENASLLRKFEGIRNKEYFLIHGTLDDNVHYQQSMLWAKILEHKDILFRQLSYPDEHHGLDSVRPHLYHSLEKFLDDCFVGNEY